MHYEFIQSNEFAILDYDGWPEKWGFIDVDAKVRELVSVRDLIVSSHDIVISDWSKEDSVGKYRLERECYSTLFLNQNGLNVLVRIYPRSLGHHLRGFELILATTENVTVYTKNHGLAFRDDTLTASEDFLRGLSKRNAIGIVDRWIDLLSPLSCLEESERRRAAAKDLAQQFVHSVANLAGERGALSSILTRLESDTGGGDPEAHVQFASQWEPANVIFSDFQDDFGTEYTCLSNEAAAIFSAHLPSVIQVCKTWKVGRSEDWSNEPYGLQFRPWRSSFHSFTQNSLLSPLLLKLPRMPADAIFICRSSSAF